MKHLVNALPRMALVGIAFVAATAAWGTGAEPTVAAGLPVGEVELGAVPEQAAPDEGGTGVNNFDREEWYEFSILLAPFLVLVTFILILMFRWDRGSGEGE